jgi:hypothetical protein
MTFMYNKAALKRIQNVADQAATPSLPTFSQNRLNPNTFALVGISFSPSLRCPPHLRSSLPFPTWPSLANFLTKTLTSGLPSSTLSTALDPFRLHSSTQPLNTSLTFSFSILRFVEIKAGAIRVCRHSCGKTPCSTRYSGDGRWRSERLSLIWLDDGHALARVLANSSLRMGKGIL